MPRLLSLLIISPIDSGRHGSTYCSVRQMPFPHRVDSGTRHLRHPLLCCGRLHVIRAAYSSECCEMKYIYIYIHIHICHVLTEPASSET